MQEWKQLVYELVACVPRGQVATYGQIAGLLGHPRRGRHVGHALRQTPQGLDIPWHRIINARGESALPEGSMSREIQIHLLRDEGVEVNASGRIDLRRFGWKP